MCFETLVVHGESNIVFFASKRAFNLTLRLKLEILGKDSTTNYHVKGELSTALLASLAFSC